MPGRAPSRTRRFRRGPDPVAVLAAAEGIAGDLRDGLAGTGAHRAARRLGRLLGGTPIGLGDLSGSVAWAGAPPSGLDDLVEHVVREALHGESPLRSGRLTGVPLHVRDELAGVLLLHGPVTKRAIRVSSRLIMNALEHGRLEASADQAAEAEMRALRAEISPHFVYNALTVIASLVRSDPERACDLMLDFADYTRYSLAGHGEYTTLAEEFRAVETYLALQRAVLGERLRVQVRVAPEVLAVAVPYLVLEPLVENAIRHGIEPRAEIGTVQVRGEAVGNECVISVEDDGMGMEPAALEAILAGRGEEGSVGLANVDRRLRHVYGSWFGLVVETEVGAGTRVVVRVPRFQPGVVAQ
ncbi:sensor histidine kinase [Amycolatopsis antarctica]|uniref:Sensor histidine kinase n=1 Tax=Amycolatopsis antarctica TaxID=1854586 RepID=A0A263CWA3_9PSEU|nr:histidine kinase [Amycolatopsis antarctica]OZM70412.1 sensor histidine kinase [Amycolatopsis antarctica]